MSHFAVINGVGETRSIAVPNEPPVSQSRVYEPDVGVTQEQSLQCYAPLAMVQCKRIAGRGTVNRRAVRHVYERAQFAGQLNQFGSHGIHW